MRPPSSCVLGPCGDLDQRLRPQLAWTPLSISAAANQTRPLEDLQMTGDGRETDRERLGQLEHGCLTVGQPSHDRAPRGVRQGGEDEVEPIGGRHGHRCRRSWRYFIDWLFNRVTTYSQGPRSFEAAHRSKDRARARSAVLDALGAAVVEATERTEVVRSGSISRPLMPLANLQFGQIMAISRDNVPTAEMTSTHCEPNASKAAREVWGCAAAGHVTSAPVMSTGRVAELPGEIEVTPQPR